MGLAWQGDKIMKKFFACMVALMAMSIASVYADGQSAMLQQQDGTISLFYGKNALKEAYAAAADSGAVITLSRGTFGNLVVEKQLTIVGYHGFSDTGAESTLINSIVVKADDVMIDGVYFVNYVGLDSIRNCRLIHSWINKFQDNPQWNTYTIVDQCVVKDFTYALQRSTDLVVRNSTVYFDCYNTGLKKNPNMAYIVNCVIYMPGYTGYWDDSVCREVLPYATFKNNIFYFSDGVDSRATALIQDDYSKFFNNTWAIVQYSYDYISLGPTCVVEGHEVVDASDILPEATYPAYPVNPTLGSDGTPRGPLGGSGFTDKPSIPRITSREIDTNPDADGKVNVKITVSAE